MVATSTWQCFCSTLPSAWSGCWIAVSVLQSGFCLPDLVPDRRTIHCHTWFGNDPQYRPRHNIILMMGTPKMVPLTPNPVYYPYIPLHIPFTIFRFSVPLVLGNPHFGRLRSATKAVQRRDRPYFDVWRPRIRQDKVKGSSVLGFRV